ncbi:MAG: LUD domain-containing protein [Rhodopirellula sp.]|nr:LUD domain-containing protein [Rhodopirellula sp.]
MTRAMSSRDTILSRIRTALSGEPPVERPPVPEVWPPGNPSVEEMADRFAEELQAVSGEIHRAATMEDARRRLAELLDELSCDLLGAIDRPICRDVLSEIPSDHLAWPEAGGTARTMCELAAGLVPADALLADTGSCLIACGTPQERLLCYLPPVCIVIARTDQLVEHLPAVWESIASRSADPNLRGEFVLVTGPSRTADIEKILILGVHGPKRLIVLLVG